MGNMFDGLADGYQRYRPDYPAAAIRNLVDRVKDIEAGHYLDLGAGTGILTRQIFDDLPETWLATAVEPGADMRHVCATENGDRNITVVNGSAEALPENDCSVDLLTVAQALHWFDRPAFYAEAARVLKPGGVLAILYNDRDNSDPLLSTFEDGLEAANPGYHRDYRKFAFDGEIEALDWVAKSNVNRETWSWQMSPDDFAGLMLSRSKTQPWADRDRADNLRRYLIELAGQYANGDNLVALPYVTTVTVAVRV